MEPNFIKFVKTQRTVHDESELSEQGPGGPGWAAGTETLFSRWRLCLPQGVGQQLRSYCTGLQSAVRRRCGERGGGSGVGLQVPMQTHGLLGQGASGYRSATQVSGSKRHSPLGGAQIPESGGPQGWGKEKRLAWRASRARKKESIQKVSE